MRKSTARLIIQPGNLCNCVCKLYKRKKPGCVKKM